MNLYGVCDCGLVGVVLRSKTGFTGFRDCSRSNIVFWDGKIPRRMTNKGVPEFSHHPCESAVPTSDGHNFPVQTPIHVFLDSTEIL